MPNTWFTADFHLGHANIIRYCNRPFSTVEEMDQAIVERLNASAKPNDVLYFLGDFCMGGSRGSLHIADEFIARKSSPCPEITTSGQVERRIFLARQSGGSFDSRPIDRALPLRPASLEPVQSRIMAPLWPFSRTSS